MRNVAKWSIAIAIAIGSAGMTIAEGRAQTGVGLGDGEGENKIRGCWFTPPNPPACDTCADSCNPGQKCCVILSF